MGFAIFMWRRVGLLFLGLIISASDSDARLRKKITPKPYSPKYSSIVMDAETGQVLHNEDADGIRHPASLTKMMTLYMAFEALREGRITLETRLPVSARASRQAPSKLGLSPGETIPLKATILGLVTKSANDAAVVMAEFLGGSEEAFARKMTQKARALGMSSTVFKNASGLPNPSQITSARDMAILSRALYRDYPNQYKYFSLRSFFYKGTEHRNHNHLLGKVKGVDGIKTGFIGASGFNLAASAVRATESNQRRRLITVVMGGPNRHWRDRRVTELFEIYFARNGAHRDVPIIEDDQLNDMIAEHDSEPDLSHEISFETTNDQAESTPDIDTLLHETINEDTPAMAQTCQYTPEEPKTLPANWIKPSAPPNAKKTYSKRTIQLTTVSSEKKAKSIARDAVRKIGYGKINVHKVKRGRKTLYSPQIVGIPAPQANGACKILSGKCIVLA